MVKEQQARVIYKKSEELSKSGFVDFEAAKELQEQLLAKYPEPGHRVRVRLRSRTNTWDVVVKVRTEVKAEQQKAAA